MHTWVSPAIFGDFRRSLEILRRYLLAIFQYKNSGLILKSIFSALILYNKNLGTKNQRKISANFRFHEFPPDFP
jgi:hypothetical protein